MTNKDFLDKIHDKEILLINISLFGIIISSTLGLLGTVLADISTTANIALILLITGLVIGLLCSVYCLWQSFKLSRSKNISKEELEEVRQEEASEGAMLTADATEQITDIFKHGANYHLVLAPLACLFLVVIANLFVALTSIVSFIYVLFKLKRSIDKCRLFIEKNENNSNMKQLIAARKKANFWNKVAQGITLLSLMLIAGLSIASFVDYIKGFPVLGFTIAVFAVALIFGVLKKQSLKSFLRAEKTVRELESNFMQHKENAKLPDAHDDSESESESETEKPHLH